ncbi:juvenile hormone esterase-like [Leptidea sinapis]|uniref:juvenile hormone esterase-like n=1 Tax=Leptidea sinapis TaxID=189913 RepID=UPI0021207CC2|nr:juvenile hormone esterase-like [Leptidea sinapis]
MQDVKYSIIIYFVIFLISVIECHKSRGDNERPTVIVKEGILIGKTSRTFYGDTYYSFKGIPYAEAPTGEHRFEAPLRPKPWNGEREATEHGPVCTQINFSLQVVGSEQCLFLNIYTRSLKSNAKIPVMVFIHGGSYQSGSGNSDNFSPDLLLEHGVIIVTINYRQEVLGYLSLDLPSVPGNAGMKDQVMALRWLKENIAKFGGDPDSVTIFGESSGSTSVTYLVVSDMAKGLFNKAIAQSGVCLQDWSQGRDMVGKAFRAAKALGKEIHDVNELLKFFNSLPAGNLTNLNEASMTEEENYRGLPERFVPVIEQSFPNVESFLDENPKLKLASGRVNNVTLMLGYNSGEGISIISYIKDRLDVKNKNPSYFVPRDIAERVSEEKMKDLGRRIVRFYGGVEGCMQKDNVDGLKNMATDIYFAFNTHRFAYLYNNGPVYMYRFDYDTDLNIVKNRFTTYQNVEGASHGDELFYIFFNEFNKNILEKEPKLRNIAREVTKLWTNFAKTGNPTRDNSLGVKWKPYTKSGKEFMNINQNYTMGSFADRQRIEFWNQIYKEAGLSYIDQ